MLLPSAIEELLDVSIVKERINSLLARVCVRPLEITLGTMITESKLYGHQNEAMLALDCYLQGSSFDLDVVLQQ